MLRSEFLPVNCKIKEKELWACLYQGYWRRQVSGSCSINLDNCVQKLADRQRKKGGATTCAVKFDDPRGVFNRKKSFFDRVTRNFDCHVFEQIHRCSWNTHEGCKFEWDVWKWLISKLTTLQRSYGRRDHVLGICKGISQLYAHSIFAG